MVIGSLLAARLRMQVVIGVIGGSLSRFLFSHQPITLSPSKQQRHLAEPAQEATAPLDLVSGNGEPQVRVTPNQRLEGDLPLDAGQRRSQTDVDPLAECDVAVGILAADIERVGSNEALRVAIGACETDCDLISGGDTRASDFEIFRGET